MRVCVRGGECVCVVGTGVGGEDAGGHAMSEGVCVGVAYSRW